MKFISRIITEADRDRWNDFVANSPESPILQSYEWGELKAKFGWEPIRIAVEEEGKIVAGVSLLKRKLPKLPWSFFYAPRGPVVNYSNREQIDFLLHAVEHEAERHHAFSLKIDPDFSENQHMELATLKRIGFVKASRQVQPRATYYVDLTPELDDLLKSFEEKTRYNIRLAEKKGVTVKEEPTKEGIEKFFKLYIETSRRDNFLIHPLNYYQTIRRLMFEKGLGSLFIAYHQDQPIGAVIVFCFGKKIWYMYGASGAEHRQLMPNHLLHWQIIKWAKEKGYQTYDLWGIPAKPDEHHPLWGVYRFKKGFRGKMVVNIGAYDYPYLPLFHTIFEHGVDWIKNIRSLLLKGRIEDSLGE